MNMAAIGTATPPASHAGERRGSRGGLLLVGLGLGAACLSALPTSRTVVLRLPRSGTAERPDGVKGSGNFVGARRSALNREARARRPPDRGDHPRLAAAEGGGAPSGNTIRTSPRRSRPAAVDRSREMPVRRLYQGAAALSFSILADSAMEHYRGGFYNPAMFAAPAVSALTLLTSASMATRPERSTHRTTVLFGAAALTGLAGFGFHACNISRRIGGWSWRNLFYGPPIAAPLGLTAAGLLGLSATRIGRRMCPRPRLLSVPSGRVIAGGAAAGLLGTAVEAGMLHFRGAFQRPAMYIPVTVPPFAAIALSVAAVHPTRTRLLLARGLLRITAAIGLGGMAFHAHGVHRYMGGWRNWSQNLLMGPPLPAPPSFTGMALAGLGALTLLEEESDE